MQILVVVAIIQMRILKAEVEKGSMRTVFGHGLLDPKTERKRFQREVFSRSRKGMRLTFLKLVAGRVWQHKQAQRHQRELLEEFSFLLNCLKPWNWIIQRDGCKAGRAVPLDCQVRSR